MTTLMDIKDTINDIDAAIVGYSSVSNRKYHFTNDKDVDIEIHGVWEEPGWEYFVPDIKIDLNGVRLYGTGSRNVSSYHNESYQEGIYATPDEALSALERHIDLDGLSRRDYAPNLKDRDMKETLDAFMGQPDVQASLQLREQTREVKRAARLQAQQAEEDERQHWNRVNEYGGFIHAFVHPSQIHPVKSQTALKWDKGYREGQEQSSSRTIQDGPERVTNSAPVWIDVAEGKRIFVSAGLVDRLEDNKYQVTMEPNNTKKVFTGASLKGEDVPTSDIEEMLTERWIELDARQSGDNFITVPSDNVRMRQRKSDGAQFGVVTLPTNGVGEHSDTMMFTVDARQMKSDPVQAGSVLINLNRKRQYKVQYSAMNNQSKLLDTEALTREVAGAMSAIAWQNADKNKRLPIDFIESTELSQQRVSNKESTRDKVDALTVDGSATVESENQFE